jgi:hypothetical protein
MRLSEIPPTPTPTIKPIILDLPDTTVQKLKQQYNSNRTSSWNKEAIQKKLGGRCCVCGELASQIASYDCAGATRIERYCDSCVKKTFARSEKVGI